MTVKERKEREMTVLSSAIKETALPSFPNPGRTELKPRQLGRGGGMGSINLSAPWFLPRGRAVNATSLTGAVGANCGKSLKQRLPYGTQRMAATTETNDDIPLDRHEFEDRLQ